MNCSPKIPTFGNERNMKEKFYRFLPSTIAWYILVVCTGCRYLVCRIEDNYVTIFTLLQFDWWKTKENSGVSSIGISPTRFWWGFTESNHFHRWPLKRILLYYFENKIDLLVGVLEYFVTPGFIIILDEYWYDGVLERLSECRYKGGPQVVL